MRLWCAALAACLAHGCSADLQETPPPASPCVTYCGFAFQNCINSPILYQSWDACMDQCSAFASTGNEGDVRGNTLQCRLTYVQVAKLAPQAFCDNAGPDGGDQCI